MARLHRISTPALVVLCFVIGADSAVGEAPSRILTGYNITSWGAADGLPYGDIHAIAQDREGYLWLGTMLGLVKFDGLRFTTWAAMDGNPIPTQSVNALLVSHSGDLWVGFAGRGGIARIRRDASRQLRNVRPYLEHDGLPQGTVSALLEDGRGTIWAGSSAGLFWLDNDRWQRWTGRGLPDGAIHALYFDNRDRLFVSTWTGVFALSSERAGFERLKGTEREGKAFRRGDGPPDDWIGSITIDERDRVWIVDRLAGFKIIDGSAVLSGRESGRGRCLLQDRVGNLWVGTAGQGLWRVKSIDSPNNVMVDRATELTGLLGNGVLSLFEDRDGNIWVGTIEGLNRLRPGRATALSSLGLVSGLAAEHDAVWVVASGSVSRVKAAAIPQGIGKPPDWPATITAVHSDERGRVWIARGNHLVLTTGTHSEEVNFGGALGGVIDLLASDRKGGVWLHDSLAGVLHWNGTQLLSSGLSHGEEPSPLLWMNTQRDQTLWLLGAEGRVLVVRPDGALRQYGPADGLEPNAYRTMYEDAAGAIWLGGARGLARFRNGRFQSLRQMNGHALVNMTAIIEDESGLLWLGTGSSVVAFHPADFDRAIASPTNRIPFRLYTSESLAGNPRWYGQNAGVRAADGRLWFVTSQGIAVVDPRVVPVKQDPTGVGLDSVIVDGDAVQPRDGVRLRPGTKKLELGFGALALSTPECTHFRYKLDGFDAAWVESGTRRHAAYTNLPAGHYRFHLMASGADGTWPDADAVWIFSIAPMFYRTPWFLGGCVLFAAVSVVGAWRMHLRQVRARFSLVLAERTRLSREIHDTLLQGLFGVALRCDAIASDMEAPSPRLREHFIQMRRDVEQYIREARQSIWNLRSAFLEQRGIASALRRAGEHATSGHPVHFVFTVEREPKACTREIEEHLLRIGQEGVANAIRHAHASEIRMVLRYEDAGVILRIGDDGLGFDPNLAEENGHYGLVNMRERAEAAGGHVRIESCVGGGTVVEVRVPYERAAGEA